jgi:hypothetical protein
MHALPNPLLELIAHFLRQQWLKDRTATLTIGRHGEHPVDVRVAANSYYFSRRIRDLAISLFR